MALVGPVLKIILKDWLLGPLSSLQFRTGGLMTKAWAVNFGAGTGLLAFDHATGLLPNFASEWYGIMPPPCHCVPLAAEVFAALTGL